MSERPKTVEELRDEILKKKLAVYDNMKYMLQDGNPDHCGYRGKTREEAALLMFKKAVEDIEKMCNRYERDNPA